MQTEKSPAKEKPAMEVRNLSFFLWKEQSPSGCIF